MKSDRARRFSYRQAGADRGEQALVTRPGQQTRHQSARSVSAAHSVSLGLRCNPGGKGFSRHWAPGLGVQPGKGRWACRGRPNGLFPDKGYLSGAVLKRVKSYGVRSYIPEKRQKGKRRWRGKAEEQPATYDNRRRVRGDYGKRLLKRRGELVERSFAHCYETGGMRRCHLRKRENILKRQLAHVSAFNLSLVMRQLLGPGTPRELKNRAIRLVLRLILLLTCQMSPENAVEPQTAPILRTDRGSRAGRTRCRIFGNSATCTTG
jgi:hypothetical protein